MTRIRQRTPGKNTVRTSDPNGRLRIAIMDLAFLLRCNCQEQLALQTGTWTILTLGNILGRIRIVE